MKTKTEPNALKLITFIKDFSYSDIPRPIVEKAKMLILDSIGTMFLGASEKDTSSISEYVKEEGGRGPCTIIGSRVKTTLPRAVFANSFLTQVHDANDGNSIAGNQGGDVHPGRHVIPAALSSAEASPHKVTGKDLITAVVIGYEISSRLQARGRSAYKFHTFAPAARLLRLSYEQINAAMVIAGYLSSDFCRLTKNKLCIDDYALGNGYASAAGIEAVLLAQAGFKTQPAVIDTPSVHLDTVDLGKTFSIKHVYTKPWPTCRCVHPATEAILKIKDETHFKPEDIKSIEIGQYPGGMYTAFALEYAHRSRPYLNGNLYYIGACAALFGHNSPEVFCSPKIDDKRIFQFAKKIKVTKYEAKGPGKKNKTADLRPVIVTIKFKDGKKSFCEVSKPKGHWENPLPENEHFEKFVHWSSGCISRSHASKIGDEVAGIEKAPDIKRLMKLLAAPKDS